MPLKLSHYVLEDGRYEPPRQQKTDPFGFVDSEMQPRYSQQLKSCQLWSVSHLQSMIRFYPYIVGVNHLPWVKNIVGV